MTRQVFVFILFFVSLTSQYPLESHAQNPEVNRSKYWHYRERLVHDFMVVGPDAGQSIPAGVRNLWDGSGLHFGDAPVYLGYYIAVLATEYTLLHGNGQQTDRSLTELYYALEAVNRLDAAAEPLWGIQDAQQPLNGFLLECDVPADFCQRYSRELNSLSPAKEPLTGKLTRRNNPVDYVESPLNAANCLNNTCSQDHLACLLMGLSLCVHFAPDSTAFLDQLTGRRRVYSFRTSAIAITERVMHYLHDAPFGGSAWTLHVPGGRRISNGKGGNAVFNAFGFAQAGKAITGKNYDTFGSGLTHLYWKSIYNWPFFTRLHPDDLLFGLELSAMGDSWNSNKPGKKTSDRIRKTGSYPTSGIPGLYAANDYGWDLFYTSLYALLHPASGMNLQSDSTAFQRILNSAPFEGPYYHGPGDCAPGGWAGSSGRFYDHPPNQLQGKEGFRGNYNGLDYMLFYNFYCLLNSTITGQNATPLPYLVTQEFTQVR
ncbi:MAG TPA: hypothetical protein VGO45_10340 [Bacteroidia bacterium]|jgi:hypothetical protein|nr:hypothetical protein [Bacteroidia bacterium]